MSHKKKVALTLYENNVQGSLKETLVPLVTALICHITQVTFRALESTFPEVQPKVYVSTRVIKHLYDKKPAEEFFLVVEKMYKIVKMPDRIYINKDPKRGHLVFVKLIHTQLLMCSLEIQADGTLHVVTAYRVDEKYLAKYELLWKWKDDTPSS